MPLATTEPKTYTFRFPSMVDRDGFAADAVLLDTLHPDRSLDLKWKAILRLNCPVHPGDDPATSWLRAMCEENGEPYTTPVPPGLASALIGCRPAYVFYYWLV